MSSFVQQTHVDVDGVSPISTPRSSTSTVEKSVAQSNVPSSLSLETRMESSPIATRIVRVLVDSVIIIPTLALLVWLTYLATNNGKAIDEYYETHQRALSVIAPMFPFLFAAIIGRTLYQISHWELEHGTCVGTLEQLMGSQTLGSALLTHFHLRSWNVLTFFILVVWASSPIGAQSLLQVLDRRSLPLSTSARYFGLYHSSLNEINEDIDNSFYLTALQSHRQVLQGPYDVWGNLKVPFLPAGDEAGWSKVDDTSALGYSAFVGIPVVNVARGNTTFVMESEHIQLNCTPIVVSANDSPDYTWEPVSITNLTGGAVYGTRHWANGTWYGDPQSGGAMAAWTLGVDQLSNRWYPPRDRDYSDFGPTHLLFQARGEGIGPRVRTKCRVLNRYTELRVNCSKLKENARATCRVVALRVSPKDRPSMNLSVLNYAGDFGRISTHLPRVIRLKRVYKELHLEYLYDRDLSRLSAANFPSNITDEFALRLSQVLNSYILINQAQFTSIPIDGHGDQFPSLKRPIWTDTPAETTDTDFVYSISHPWMAACLSSCMVLFVGGVVGVIFSHLNRAPQFLGYVSTTLRDSRYLETPSILDGIDGAGASLMLKGNRIRYGVYQLDATNTGTKRIGIGLEVDVTPMHGYPGLQKGSADGSITLS